MTYSRVTAHRAMVFDKHRNAMYARALRSVVRPGSVVMDLGAGLGLHGLVAAQAGARVYLVEPEAVVLRALDAARAAGLADRITVVQQRIEDASIDDRCDAIVSVLTGNLLFSEDLLPLLLFARDRFLKPDGALIPDRAQLWLAPIHSPALHDKYVAAWSQPALGFDYSSGRANAANEVISLAREDLVGSLRLAEGAAVADLDLLSITNSDCDAKAAMPVASSGLCHGLLAWTRMRLGGEWLSTEPTAPAVHWSPVFLPIDPPLALREGETIEVSLHRPAHGDWTWSIRAVAGARRHSTFLAGTEGPRELARAAKAARPGLSTRGARALRALQLLEARASVEETAQAITTEFAVEAAAALREVQALARRHGGDGT